MAKHYSVNGNTVVAEITKLTDKELAEVQRYKALGFEVIAGKVDAPKTEKRLDDAYIRKYLENDTAGLAEYEKLVNANVLNDDGSVKYHIITDKKTKTQKQGKPYKQGFNAGRNWFAKTYPVNVSEAVKAIAEANLGKAFDKAWKAYDKKEAEEGKTKMTKDEYTKDYYWKKVFVNN
jgi:hypothetical protein